METLRIPRTSRNLMNTMGFVEFHSAQSTESHEFHGIPLVPWNSTDLEPHGFHGVSWPPRIPPTDSTAKSDESLGSMLSLELHGIPQTLCNFMEAINLHEVLWVPWGPQNPWNSMEL